jgi:DNA replication protein DnaC
VSETCPHDLCDGTGWILDDATNSAAPCECRAQRISVRRARSLSGVIPKRFQGVSFDRPPVTEIDANVVREVRRYVRAIDAHLDAGRGLWLMGDVGTGKTTLAMLVSKAALEARRAVAIYSLPRLLAEIRTSYDDDARQSYTELIDRLALVDLLHVDDVGAERTNDWVLEQLYSIVNARYEDGKAIVITTNLDPAELREQIGERTVSRLVEICGDPLPLFGHDRRTEHRGDAASLLH